MSKIYYAKIKENGELFYPPIIIPKARLSPKNKDKYTEIGVFSYPAGAKCEAIRKWQEEDD